MEIFYIIRELLSISIMALALGMDAFSVGLGIGMKGIRLKNIFYIGLLVGFFHIIMPSIGMLLGKVLHYYFAELAAIIGGTLLIALGINMLVQTFRTKKNENLITFAGIVMFAFSVSLDSFSLGFSLGIFGTRAIATITIFGIVATVLTWLGLYIGKKFKSSLGNYGELLGGIILIYFGLDNLL